MQDGRSHNHKGGNAAGLCAYICIDSAQGKRGESSRAYQGKKRLDAFRQASGITAISGQGGITVRR